MAPIAIDDIEEAPSSPRTAALYYWGGGGGNNNDNDDCKINVQSHHKSDVSTLREYTASGGAGHHYRHHHRRRQVIKFHLEMDDEDDCNHWMLLRRPAAPVQEAAATDSFMQATTPQDENNHSEVLQSQNQVKQVSEDSPDEQVTEEESYSHHFDTIPVIDLEEPLETYAKQIGDACRDIGFFYIINHGIEECIMNDVMDASKRLFDLDLESKLALTGRDDDDGAEKKGYRGYFGIGAEDLDNKDGTRDLASEEQQHRLKKKSTTRGDFKEGFDVGLEHGGDTNNACHAFFGKNVWPDEDNHGSVLGFRRTLLRYQDKLLKLADKLMVAFAMSLNSDGGAVGLPMDYFLTKTRNPMCTLRLLHYPPSLDMSNSGCGAHTDYGLFTILQQDSIGGLQVRNHAKKWIDAKPLRGSFVINVGDMLSHWTSGVYASTVHRVVSPSGGNDYHRYSAPFFFNPDHNAVVEPILSDASSSEDGHGEGGRSNCLRRRRSSALEILQSRYSGTFQSDK